MIPRWYNITVNSNPYLAPLLGSRALLSASLHLPLRPSRNSHFSRVSANPPTDYCKFAPLFSTTSTLLFPQLLCLQIFALLPGGVPLLTCRPQRIVSPNSHEIISFANPQPLNLIESYRSKKGGRRGPGLLRILLSTFYLSPNLSRSALLSLAGDSRGIRRRHV